MGGNRNKRQQRPKQQKQSQQVAQQAQPSQDESATAEGTSACTTCPDVLEESKTKDVPCQCANCATKQADASSVYQDVVTPTFNISEATVVQQPVHAKNQSRSQQERQKQANSQDECSVVVTMQEVIDQQDSLQKQYQAKMQKQAGKWHQQTCEATFQPDQQQEEVYDFQEHDFQEEDDSEDSQAQEGELDDCCDDDEEYGACEEEEDQEECDDSQSQSQSQSEEEDCCDQEEDFSGESFQDEPQHEPINSQDPRFTQPSAQTAQASQASSQAQQPAPAQPQPSQQQRPNTAQGQPQQPQQQQTQKQINDAQTKLGSNLTDMLINLYNGKPTTDFQDHYAAIAQIIESQRRLQANNANQKQPEITSEALFDLFTQKIESIVGTVKDKLNEDAKKDGLIVTYANQQAYLEAIGKGPLPAEDKAAAKPQAKATAAKGSTQKHDVIQVAKDYREYQPKFDEILSAVGDYFELFKNNTNKLEDLWLQLLDFLKLKNHSEYTMFKRCHYKTYIRKVIKYSVIQKITEEAQKWVGTPGASENLEQYLEKIREIEKDAQFISDTYESFKRKEYLDKDLNQYTVEQMRLEQQRKKKEAQLETQKRAQQQCSTQVDQQQFHKQHAVCQDRYNDCHQFEQHRKSLSHGAQCHCKCIAKHHLFQSHYVQQGINQAHKSTRAQRGKPPQNEKRGSQAKELAEQAATGGPDGAQGERQGTDEQVYKKDLDELIEYINQPKDQTVESKKKKNKNKAKKGTAKDTSPDNGGPEPPDPSKVASVTNQAQPSDNGPSNRASSKANRENPEVIQQAVSSAPARAGSNAPEKSSQYVNSFQKTAYQCSSADALEPLHSSTAIASKGGANLTDEQFDYQIVEFERRLGATTSRRSQRKLRPNYDETWELDLKRKLQMIDKQRGGNHQRGSFSQTSTANSSQQSAHAGKR